MITQQTILDSVVEDFINSPKYQGNDIPAIREALNDRMDYYEKEGELTRSRSDRWSQDRMVKAVLKSLSNHYR